MLATPPTAQRLFIPPLSNNHGYEMSYLRWGKGKSTVLCVHGLTRNAHDFDVLASAFDERFQIICPDMPGRGESDRLSTISEYTNAAYLPAIVHLLDHLQIDKVHWIGTSMGGILGMMMANSHPGKLSSLTLNDVGCFIPASGLARIRDTAANIKTLFDSRQAAEAVYRARCATFGIKEEAQWGYLLRYGLREKNGQWEFTYDPAILTAGFPKDMQISDVNLWALWDAVKVLPTLLIRGKQSDLLSHETALQMQQQHPNLRLHEVLGAGHAPMLMDHTEKALIRDWISALS